MDTAEYLLRQFYFKHHAEGYSGLSGHFTLTVQLRPLCTTALPHHPAARCVKFNSFYILGLTISLPQISIILSYLMTPLVFLASRAAFFVEVLKLASAILSSLLSAHRSCVLLLALHCSV